MKTILVVEDFSAAQQFLRETLESKGYETLGATNCNKAFEILNKHPQRIDLVLTDYHIPELSGLELLIKIKDDSNLKKIPVIFLTGETNPDIIKKAEQVGFSSWIKKPYLSQVLMNEIEKALKAGHS